MSSAAPLWPSVRKFVRWRRAVAGDVRQADKVSFAALGAAVRPLAGQPVAPGRVTRRCRTTNPMSTEPTPSFLRPPPERGLPLAWLAAIVLLLAIAGWQWWRMNLSAPTEPPAAASVPRTGDAGRRPAPEASRAPAMPAPVAPDPAQAGGADPQVTTVTRCVAGGRTTFTDGACAPGAEAGQLQVQRTLNLADGAPHLPRAQLPRAAPAVHPPVVAQAAPAAQPDRRSECLALAAQIEQLDAQARQPQSGQMQDWITQRRHVVRNRQFHLRC